MSAIDKIRRLTTKEKVLSVLEKYGANNIQMIGDTYRCACPIHGGANNTTFSYNPDNHLWCCFAECGGGDVFTLIAMLNDIDIETRFKEVIKRTAEELNIDIDGMDIGKHEADYQKDVDSWLRYSLKRNQIFNTPYDIKTLGDRYRLNKYRDISPTTLEQYGVGYLKELNKYIFPIFNESGDIIGASLRAVGNEMPKWLHRPKSIKTGMVLYNLKYCIDNNFRKVYIVEGIIDVLRLVDIGVRNVVCTFGARVTDEQKYMLLKHFDEVVLAFDNDSAGKQATKKAIEKLRYIINTEVLVIPSDLKDVGELRSIEEFNEMEVISWSSYISKEEI